MKIRKIEFITQGLNIKNVVCAVLSDQYVCIHIKHGI